MTKTTTDRIPLKIIRLKKGESVESFQNSEKKLIVLGNAEIFTEEDRSKKKTLSTADLNMISELRVDDFVIHIDHGIAKFAGLVSRDAQNQKREFLHLAYAGGDALFVPIENADRVSRYLGASEDIKLTRLGSAEWSQMKKRLKKDTAALAKELLDLYAKRAAMPGIKLNFNTKYLAEFDENFPYELTDGQAKAVRDVYADLASAKPMDRLICGDVGFGKTEVAMRAAFRAVSAGKQVAVLAPITILADQHLKSFRKRMDGFPIKIEVLSRFRTPQQQKITLEHARKGSVDIVIGTHRLLSDDVKFKDIGLVIVDEEQRFGVKQKEKLKQMRADVDILTLTATPIPRTLNLSLNGLRDVSVIDTPPPGRLPVISEVRKLNWGLMREAIMREVNRGGQTYVLHNRVETIETFAQKLRNEIPEAKFIVAHGQLSPHELEDRISAFKNGKFDVLVSSTIIENGIDLSNANTMIIDHAERFGLSQLYQLRGRIGRGSRQAYAFFLYHSQKLPLAAKMRLKAVMEATELGAGFQIAIRDLEIRGAGNVLGSEQSGTMESIGLTHFTRMLAKAVEDRKHGRITDLETDETDVSIDLPASGILPDGYVDDRAEKVKIYQKLANCENEERLRDTFTKMETVFGKAPAETEILREILLCKIYARNAGVQRVLVDGDDLFVLLGKSVKPPQIIAALDIAPYQIIGDKLKIKWRALEKAGGLLKKVKETLQKMHS